MTKYLVTAYGSKHSFKAEVGPIDPERWTDKEGNPVEGFAFGDSAEVFAFTPGYGEEEGVIKYEVTMGAIGSHSPARAKRRMLSYKIAIAIAEQANVLANVESDPFDFERMAATFDGFTVDKTPELAETQSAFSPGR